MTTTKVWKVRKISCLNFVVIPWSSLVSGSQEQSTAMQGSLALHALDPGSLTIRVSSHIHTDDSRHNKDKNALHMVK